MEQKSEAGTVEPAEAVAATTACAGETEAAAPEQDERRCDSDASTEVGLKNFFHMFF